MCQNTKDNSPIGKKIICKNCNNTLSSKDNFCPKCGDTKKMIEMHFRETVGIHDWAIGKLKNKNKKLIYQFRIGKSFFKKTRQWHNLERIFDKINNFYKEFITDKNGKVIRDIEEPLSDHRGRGSAKYQK